MKPARLALITLACALPLAASAQWMWIDKDGHKVLSDRAPSADVTPDRILRAPKGSPMTAAAMQPAPAAEPAGNGNAAPALPRPAGKDKALEERKNKLAAAEAEKKKEEEAKVVAQRTENCSLAKKSKANYTSGQRIVKVNEQGERRFLDDNEIAAEVKRLDTVIARDCVQ